MTTKFLRRREVEEVTGLSRSTIYALMSRGEFPKPVKVSTRAVRWRSDAIERWQESRVGGDLPPNPPRRRNPDGDARRTGKRHAGIRNQGGVGRRGAGTPPRGPAPFEFHGRCPRLRGGAFLDASHLDATHRGGFYRWNGQHWPEIDARDVRGIAYRWLEHAHFYHPDKDAPQPFNPTRRKIDDVIDALKAVVLLDNDTSAPCWTNETAIPAREIVSMTNGLLHVPTRRMRPHTPDFFCHHSLPFAYEPECDPPSRWLAFLHELWGDDSPSIEALQETMGYILGGDTRQQKMFLFVGPKRAGKGTIGRVLTGLLGAHNVAAPTLAGLSTNFGLSPLIGKPLGLVSDARLSGRPDSNIVVERLLSVSGEDSLTIDRKYREPWTGRLPTRFVVMTNELPRLTDSSGALASRFIVFVLTKSFYGRENFELTDELLAKAPAIFNWALEGLDRLNARGHFVNPESGKAAIQELEDLSSPISAFVRDECVVGSDHRVEVAALWAAWKTWCEGDNRHPGTKAVFGRDLHAAAPMVRKIRPREGGDRTHVYEGIDLCSPGAAASSGKFAA